MAHSHDHGHSHTPASYGKAFAIGIGLNLVFVVVEAGFGLTTHSLALLADSGHNLSDVLSLCIAWGALALSRRLPTEKRTYGFKSSSILASLFNALLLLVAIGAIAWEAIGRFSHPLPVEGGVVAGVAVVGIVINSVTALLFMSGKDKDINLKGAYMHMAADALVSLGVVIAGVVIIYTGWLWLDPVVSLAIAIVILLSTWGLLKDSLNLALGAVPESVDQQGIRKYLDSLPEVLEVHDLHIWAMSTTETALTAHLVSEDAVKTAAVLDTISHTLEEKYEIAHPTIQIEMKGDHDCHLAPNEVV